MICRLLAVFTFLTVPLLAQDTWFNHLRQVRDSWEHLDMGSDRIELKPVVPLEGKQHQVMVLFPKKSSAYDTAMAQILTTFEEKKLNARFLLIHFGGDSALGSAALDHAADKQFDLIFSMGSKSTAFVVKEDIKGRVPVVSVCSKDPVLMGQTAGYESGSGTHVAFTSLDLPIRSQIAYLKRLRPNLQQIGVLYARNNTSAVKTQVEPLIEAGKRENIRVLEVVVEDQANAAQELAVKVGAATTRMAEQDKDLTPSIFWITGSTSVFREIKIINEGAGKVPVLAVVPNVVRAGDDSAVLSIGVSFENNAQIAALYGVRILRGLANPGELPVGVVSPPDIAVNFKKAQQIGLKIPFSFFESASFVYNRQGVLVREKGQNIK